MINQRDHGGGVDAAQARYGGDRKQWIDLSTGINPHPYRVHEISPHSWQSLPDKGGQADLLNAARSFWSVPDHLEIVASNGASAIIAALPHLLNGTSVNIPKPTYNEYAAAFGNANWTISQNADVDVFVHPNNPDGHQWTKDDQKASTLVVDESFGDLDSPKSFLTTPGKAPNVTIKSFGKFWGLAGIRLGFAICLPEFARRLSEFMGPWPVSGPAIEIATKALTDDVWAKETRARLAADRMKLENLLKDNGFKIAGGTDLFCLAETPNATSVYEKLAACQILTRVFPYSDNWVRLGLPGTSIEWQRLEDALITCR